MDQVHGPKVQFCATCVHLTRVPAGPDGPAHHRCARLGYRTSPRYSLHCWTPRAAYRWALGEGAGAPPGDDRPHGQN